MLKRLTGWLLICTLLSANFGLLFVYAGFECNKTLIISTLCENRDKPWLHCNGKCFLMKKVKQAEEKEKNEERQTQKSLQQEGFFERCTSIKFHTRVIQIINTPYHAPVLSITGDPVFRPPQIG